MLVSTSVARSYSSAISEAMRDLSIRAEVGTVMEGMLGDLDAWEWANKEEKLKNELEHARAQVAALKDSERTLLQREAESAAKAEEDRLVAREVRSKFVQELWGLAREFRLKEQEQGKVDQLNKKLARLEGVEAELQKTERKLGKVQQALAAAAVASRSNAGTHGTKLATGIMGNDGMLGHAGTGPASLDSADVAYATWPEGAQRGPEVAPEAEGDGERGATRAPCPFVDLEKKPLLKVFVYLSAPEVLCAAQVCRSMFRKVDLMFGIGSQAAEPASAPNPEPGSVDRKIGGGSGGSSRSRAESSASMSSSSPANVGPAAIGQRALASAFGVVVSGVEAVTAGAAATLTGGGAGSSEGAGVGLGTMSPDILDGLSKRLTTAEMKGIIILTERGRKLEARASSLQAEKEDLYARLQGTESVKEFLVAKLKETEVALKRSLDEKGLTLRQSASDQEVISFLDSKTQEMERVAQETMDKAVTYQNELQNARLNGQKQTKVLEDMLRFEKQRGEAEEAAFKSQKKLLVAEVKKLRTANLALKAECGDLRQQLKELRHSVSQLRR